MHAIVRGNKTIITLIAVDGKHWEKLHISTDRMMRLSQSVAKTWFAYLRELHGGDNGSTNF